MPWTVSYHNLSSKTLTISDWGGQYQIGLDEEDHLPKSSLGPGEQDYLQMDQDLSTLDQGPNDYWQGLTPEDDSQTVWIRVHVPLQILMMGSSPSWNFVVNDGSVPSSWGKDYGGDSPSTNFAGLKVSFSGNHSHTEVSVTAVFEDS